MVRTLFNPQPGKVFKPWVPREQWLREHADEISAYNARKNQLRHLGANEYRANHMGPKYIHTFNRWELTVLLVEDAEIQQFDRILKRHTAWGLGYFSYHKVPLNDKKHPHWVCVQLSFKKDVSMAQILLIFPTLVSCKPLPQVRILRDKKGRVTGPLNSGSYTYGANELAPKYAESDFAKPHDVYRKRETLKTRVVYGVDPEGSMEWETGWDD